MGRKRKKNKRNKGPTKSKKPVVSHNIVSIPSILGGEFDYSTNDPEYYKEIIRNAPKRDEPIRVLFSSEASYLRTGFSTYLREVFKRLHATGKFSLCEIASYGHSREMHPAAAQVPWKYYHVLPTNAIEEAEYKKDYRENQFGKWKLSYVLADFKPDIVIDVRDAWMAAHILRNPLIKNCLFFWLACIDGFPQKWQWLQDYGKLDGLFTYSHFGKKVLEEQSRFPLARHLNIKPLDVVDVIQPGVDLDVFKPLPKGEAHKAFSIPAHMKFIGTVMRNQPRKLFDRIIQSYAMFLKQYPQESKDVNLLLHTSIPDVGWDIPECIARAGVGHLVWFSYICHNCRGIAISRWQGSPTKCPLCGKDGAFHTPNTQMGFDDQHLNLVYNLMDVYVQGSIAEADAMPINEVRGAGVPCLVSDYSAMYEKARMGGALPIVNDTIYTESETMQWRSLFNRKDLAKKLARLFKNTEERKRMGREARECAEKYYSWDLTALKWEAWITSAKIKDRNGTWNKDNEIKTYVKDPAPSDLSNDEFLEWCYKNILGRNGVDGDGRKYWNTVLAQGIPRGELESHFRQLVDDENRLKTLTHNPQKLNTDPVERIRAQIEEYERNECQIKK